MNQAIRLSTRRSVLTLCGGVAMPAVAACARRAGTPGEPAQAVQQIRPASITLWAPAVGAYADWHRERVEMFMQRNPHIKVTMEPSQSEDKLQVAVVSNTPPDIWQAVAQAVFRNEKSPKEALEQMCRDAVPIMANRTK